jgi:hypothetical protein
VVAINDRRTILIAHLLLRQRLAWQDGLPLKTLQSMAPEHQAQSRCGLAKTRLETPQSLRAAMVIKA